MDSNLNAHVIYFLDSLAIGLRIGVERERAGSVIGEQEFSLKTLHGTVSALIGQSTGAVGVMHSALLTVAGIALLNPIDIDADKSGGAATRVAIVICFSLGSKVWLGHGHG